jgi:hypothetical protein
MDVGLNIEWSLPAATAITRKGQERVRLRVRASGEPLSHRAVSLEPLSGERSASAHGALLTAELSLTAQ